MKPQVSRLPARLAMSKNMAAYPAKAKIYADRRTTNRVRSSSHCRSCVPRGGALVYRRGRKGVAPEREISLPLEEKRTGRRGRRPLRGARPETWRDTCGRGVPIGGGQTPYAGAAAGIGVQAIRCGTFLHRSCNWTKGKSKNRWFLAAFFSIFLSLLKEIWPPEAYMQDAGAARNRRTKNGPSGRQPLRGARPKPRETTRARGAEYLFTSYHKSTKDCNARSAFPAAGHCI